MLPELAIKLIILPDTRDGKSAPVMDSIIEYQQEAY